ncbi:MAG: arylamine N-acetyltransferase [Gemmataceae bacterium]
MLFDDHPPPFDLEGYLARIDYHGPRRPTLDVLQAIHLAHVQHIPFENLDVLLGKPVLLDRASLHAKLIAGKRGGYCFEQNLTLADALETLGFSVTRLAARVRLGGHHITARTHMLLRVDVDGQPYLADVGFGSQGLLVPVPMSPGNVSQQFLWNYRLVAEGDLLVLQIESPTGWFDMYAFTQEQQHLVDYQVANLFIFAHPDSPFVRTLTVQRPTPEGRYSLRGLDFVIDRGSTRVPRTLVNEYEILEVLNRYFGLHFPAGTRFRSQVDRLQQFLFGPTTTSSSEVT